MSLEYIQFVNLDYQLETVARHIHCSARLLCPLMVAWQIVGAIGHVDPNRGHVLD